MSWEQVNAETSAFCLTGVDALPQAKDFFWQTCQQYGFTCYRRGHYELEGVNKTPYRTKASLHFLSHATKGEVAIIEFPALSPLSTLGSFLPAVLSCSQPGVDYCEHWTECAKHWGEGMQAFRHQFWESYRQRLCSVGVLTVPQDQSPICLDSTSLAPGVTRTCQLKCNESHSLYFDVPADSPPLRLIVQSPNRVKFSLRHLERPTLFRNDLLAITGKAHEDLHWLEVDLHKNSQPVLLPGRWFCSIRGSSLLFRSVVSISILALQSSEVEEPPVQPASDSPPSYQAHLSVSALMPEQEAEDEEEEWIFVADDSSREGRKQKPQLVGDFRETTSLPHPGQNWMPADEEVPNEFLCPISLELMQRPVVAADGFTYEQSSIETWLEGHLRSPLTGQEMADKTLRPNHALKSAIDRWRLLQSSVTL